MLLCLLLATLSICPLNEEYGIFSGVGDMGGPAKRHQGSSTEDHFDDTHFATWLHYHERKVLRREHATTAASVCYETLK